MADDPEEASAEAAAAPSPPPKKKRIYHTLHEKVSLCIKAEKWCVAEKRMSKRRFCQEHDLDPAQLRKWNKNLVNMKKAMENTTRKKTKKVCGTGRPSGLKHIEPRLMQWLDGIVAEGKHVSARQVAVRAIKCDRSLRRMERHSPFAKVRRFIASSGIADRAVTHKSQEDPKECGHKAKLFLESTRVLLSQSNRSKACILNMDQTPCNIQDMPKRTLAKKGSKTVNGKLLKVGLGRITGMLTVCADGHKLPPMLIYKGKTTGSIVREFKDYNPNCRCATQENAWTDERVMLQWVDEVLAPCVKTAPPGIVPCLLLDKHGCHYQGSVAKATEALGVEWDIIPGGCTGLVQPMDVGIGKPWKNRVRCRMEDWMIDTKGHGRVKPAVVRPLLADWAASSWEAMPKEIVYNAWRRQNLSYFPDEPTKETRTFEEHFDFTDDEEEHDDEDTSEDDSSDDDSDLFSLGEQAGV